MSRTAEIFAQVQYILCKESPTEGIFARFLIEYFFFLMFNPTMKKCEISNMYEKKSVVFNDFDNFFLLIDQINKMQI